MKNVRIPVLSVNTVNKATELYVQLRALEVLYPKEFNELLPETSKLRGQNYRTNDRGVVENQPVSDTTRSGETSLTTHEEADASGTAQGESSTRVSKHAVQRDAEEKLKKLPKKLLRP